MAESLIDCFLLYDFDGDPMVTISTQVSKTSRAGGIAQVEISSKYGCNLFRGRDSGGINVVAERIPTETNHAV